MGNRAKDLGHGCGAKRRRILMGALCGRGKKYYLRQVMGSAESVAT